MKKWNSLAACMFVAAALFSASANATVINFNFADDKGNRVSPDQPLVLIESGIQVSASASNGDLHINGTYGLGVEGNPAGNRIGEGEGVLLSFAPNEVELLGSIVFERGGAGESTFELLVDSLSAGEFTIGGGAANSQEIIDFSSASLSGSEFEFIGTSGNGFRIQEVSVQAVTAVSEPATLLLMLSGIAGFAATRRSR